MLTFSKTYYKNIVITFLYTETFSDLLPNIITYTFKVHISQLLKLSKNTVFSKEILSNNTNFFSKFISIMLKVSESYNQILTKIFFENLYQSILTFSKSYPQIIVGFSEFITNYIKIFRELLKAMAKKFLRL